LPRSGLLPLPDGLALLAPPLRLAATVPPPELLLDEALLVGELPLELRLDDELLVGEAEVRLEPELPLVLEVEVFGRFVVELLSDRSVDVLRVVAASLPLLLPSRELPVS